uniref:Omp85 domain-containing protein n=1 Tax=Haemonchus contortus TaxID=6289 RepID=A0A7I4Y9F8_HAECO|nr:Bacterial surface antigen (D15) domain containing protein [Haemonchus contortus]
MGDKTFHKASVLLGRAGDAPTVVEAVQFHGIRITKNDALVKEVSELYRSSTLDELVHNSHLAAKHFQEVGLMESAVPLIDVAPSSNGYIVNFVVKEPKAFTLGLKAGISTNGDADMSLNAGKHSVGGRGEAINSSYTYTVKGDHSFDLSFAKPFLGWQKYSNVTATLFRAISYLPWNHSNCEENAIIFGYNGRITKNILHQIKFNTLWRTLRATDDAAFLVREHAGHTTKFSIENAIGFDNRDRPILASKGMLARLTQEYAGPFGDSSFIRHQVDLQAAAPLPFGFILSASAQLKNVKGLGDREIHLLDRVYLGGQQDVRGFGLNTLGARSENSCLGGGTAACGVLHLYRPLFPPQMLFAHLFASAGSVAPVRSRNVMRDLQEMQRVSIGLGVAFIFRNIFRLEINYVAPIKHCEGDSHSTGVHIGCGINFL